MLIISDKIQLSKQFLALQIWKYYRKQLLLFLRMRQPQPTFRKIYQLKEQSGTWVFSATKQLKLQTKRLTRSLVGNSSKSNTRAVSILRITLLHRCTVPSCNNRKEEMSGLFDKVWLRIACKTSPIWLRANTTSPKDTMSTRFKRMKTWFKMLLC